MDRLNRMLQAAQGMGISAGGGPGGVSQPVALRSSPCVLQLELFCLLSLNYNVGIILQKTWANMCLYRILQT